MMLADAVRKELAKVKGCGKTEAPAPQSQRQGLLIVIVCNDKLLPYCTRCAPVAQYRHVYN